MRYVILKNEKKNDDDNHYYVSIGYNDDPQIKSNFLDKWKNLSNDKIKKEYEDFLILALSIYYLDKKIPRKTASDAWTREFKLDVPVLEKDKWDRNIHKINKLFNFLTGDIWDIHFYKTEERYYHNRNRKSNKIIKHKFDCVSLFSGGLDSFCGSIFLASQKKNIFFVGNEEYPKLKEKQENLLSILKTEFTSIDLSLVTFTANPRDTRFVGENTSRSRSIMFVAAAFAFASLNDKDDIPIYIPENGFIGLNLPLTISRTGSCSTRTTHPFFIDLLNEILNDIGIKNKLINPFKYDSKNKIVDDACKHSSFLNGYFNTYSCSHPALPRYFKKNYPMNCGYCYPCLIRRTSLFKINDKTEYWFDINKEIDVTQIMESQKKSDLVALISSVKRFISLSDDEMKIMIKSSSILSEESVEKFFICYKETMNHLKEFFTLSNVNLKDFEDY